MSTDTTTDLIRALISSVRGPDADLEGWESMAIILEFPDGAFNEAHGYLYSPEGVISAVAADTREVAGAVKAYTDGYYDGDAALPVKALVQFDRTLGNYRIQFEDTDERRWKMTPRNVRTLRAELRPSFD